MSRSRLAGGTTCRAGWNTRVMSSVVAGGAPGGGARLFARLTASFARLGRNLLSALEAVLAAAPVFGCGGKFVLSEIRNTAASRGERLSARMPSLRLASWTLRNGTTAVDALKSFHLRM